MNNKNKFRLDKAAFMTEINEQIPLKAVNGTVASWTSADSAVASIDENGLVSGRR